MKIQLDECEAWEGDRERKRWMAQGSAANRPHSEIWTASLLAFN